MALAFCHQRKGTYRSMRGELAVEKAAASEKVNQLEQAMDALWLERSLLVRQYEAALSVESKQLPEQLQAAHNLEKQALVRQHELALADAKEMTARRDREQKHLQFTVRGHGTLEAVWKRAFPDL